MLTVRLGNYCPVLFPWGVPLCPHTVRTGLCEVTEIRYSFIFCSFILIQIAVYKHCHPSILSIVIKSCVREAHVDCWTRRRDTKLTLTAVLLCCTERNCSAWGCIYTKSGAALKAAGLCSDCVVGASRNYQNRTYCVTLARVVCFVALLSDHKDMWLAATVWHGPQWPKKLTWDRFLVFSKSQRQPLQLHHREPLLRFLTAFSFKALDLVWTQPYPVISSAVVGP